jgi:hypothetical protein
MAGRLDGGEGGRVAHRAVVRAAAVALRAAVTSGGTRMGATGGARTGAWGNFHLSLYMLRGLQHGDRFS